jgi:hypothetical protein
MQYGYFDDKAKEYVITRPDTPQSWSNYLGSTDYGAIITNNAGGYGFYQSGARGRFLRLHFNSVPLDHIYTCATTRPGIIGLLPGSRLESRWINTNPHAGMEWVIRLLDPDIRG